MRTVSLRELRNHSGDVLDSVVRGESVTLTRQGEPIAELRPLTATCTPASALPARWRGIPILDLAGLRADLDDVTDPTL